VYLAGMERNGDLVDGVFGSSPAVSVALDGFSTASSIYRVELIGEEPGEFAPLAEILLRGLRPHEVQAL